MGVDDEVVVHIDDQTDEIGGTDAAVEDLKAQAEEMKREREADRAARSEAERRANAERQRAEAAEREAAAARAEAAESNADTITSGLAAAQAEQSSAEADYAAAMEAGDFKAAAKAQSRVAVAAAKIVRLDEAKADVETRKTAREEPRKRPVEAPAADAGDEVDRFISTKTAPTAKWLREHRDWVTDPDKSNKLTEAHFNAVNQKIAVDTPEYFEHVEKFIGLRQASGNGAAAPKAPRRGSTPVAPVVHSGGGMNGNGNEVRLSRGEALAATDGTHVWNYDDPSPQKRFKKGEPIGVQEFARRKQKMQQQGLYDKTYTEA